MNPVRMQSDAVGEIIPQLKEKLEKAVVSCRARAMLFSGGLDTSILLSLKSDIKPINVSLESYGRDYRYAKAVVENLKISQLYHKTVKVDEAIDSIPAVIRILKSFDPAIPNDLVVYFGLRLAKEMGFSEVMTGDGADELFGGYDFMNPSRGTSGPVKNMQALDSYIKRIARSMSFSSNELGRFFNIVIEQPYLQKELIDFALSVPVEIKIKEEKGKVHGKWVLRKTFEDSLPREILWQDKRPLESGSGMSKLREIIASRISDEEFRQKSESYSVKFINKEHLYFYEVYRREVGEIPRPRNNQKRCPGCGAGMELRSSHCKVCGHVLDNTLLNT